MVCDIEIAVAAECNSKRGDAGKGRGDTVASVLKAPVAGNGADFSVRRDFADSIVVDIGEIENPHRINRNAGAEADLGGCRRPAISPVAGSTSARDRGDDSADAYFADAIICFVGDVEIAARVHGHRPRVHGRGGGENAVSTV